MLTTKDELECGNGNEVAMWSGRESPEEASSTLVTTPGRGTSVTRGTPEASGTPDSEISEDDEVSHSRIVVPLVLALGLKTGSVLGPVVLDWILK